MQSAYSGSSTNVKLIKKNSIIDAENLISKLDILKAQMKQTILCKEFSVPRKPMVNINKVVSQKDTVISSSTDNSNPIKVEKIKEIRKNIIGFNTRYQSPFNIELEAVYVDHTATNRAYRTVQTMVDYAKKFIANPHTQFSHFGKYSTQMMHYSHDSLLKTFSAQPEDYVALPTGSGSTGAIQKAIKILKTLEIQNLKPIIFLTPYQHHSNILPWVEFYDSVNVLASDEQGNLLMDEIEQQLLNCNSQSIIVTASAASNVTSKITDLPKLNNVIKKVKAKKELIFSVDCAAYTCHHELSLKICDQIDFVHLSPHKNLGGAQSCGVLIARKSILKNSKPTFPGGGTVAFVKGYTKTDVMYDVDIFARQIAGTPPFLGFYRAALSFELLKEHIGYDFIHSREQFNTKLFMRLISEANSNFKQQNLNKYIAVYGDVDFDKRANVITFNIISEGKVVNHNFASLIFADVFGIQLRSGCFCAGPFGMRLLNLDQKTTRVIEDEVSVGILKDKPGYMRLDLTFYLEDYQIQYLANAIIGVAENHKNMELVYTLCNDGQIQRHKLFKNILYNKYSLMNWQGAQEIVQKQEQLNLLRLEKRRITLQNQLERGLAIISNPVQFLKSQSK